MATLDDLIQQYLSDTPPAPTLPELPRGSPADPNYSRSWTGLLGGGLSGGQGPGYQLRGAEGDLAGNRALLNFGINMLMASGPQRYRPDLGTVFGAGLQGAQQSMDLDQRRAQAAATQDYTQRLELAKLGVEQGRDRTERLKNALTLLQLQNRPMINPDGSVSTSSATAPSAPAGGGFTGDKAKDLALIRQRESGGDYTVLNSVAREDPSAYDRGATASGGYQIVNSTWKEGAALAGVDVSKYPRAMDAPPAVQDQVAGALYDKYGTKPWQKGAKDWVKDEQGRYQLATVRPPAGSPGGAPAGTTTATSAPPGAVRTQVAAATPTTATDATPGPLPVPPVPPAEPPPVSTVPASSMPTQTPPQVNPPNTGLPPGMMSREDFFKTNMIKPTPDEETSFKTPLGPQEEAGIVEQRKQLEQAAELARQAFNAQVPGSEAQYTAAKKALADAGAKAEEQRRLALKVGDDRRERFWEKERDRVDRLYGEMVKAAVDQGKNEFNLDQKGAEVSFNQANHRINKMGEAAATSLVVGDQLRQMSEVMSRLGEPGIAAGIAQQYPALVPYLQAAGAISPDKADAIQVMTGMANYLSTQLRPAGSGSTSDLEVRTYRSALPQLMQSPEGRQQAVAFLQNLSDRIVQEHEFALKYFRRKGPDGKPAYNLDDMQTAMQKPRKLDADGNNVGGLGPVVPHAPDWRQGADKMRSWLNENVESGHPYMGWGYPRDPRTGVPMLKDPKTGQPTQLELQLMVKD